MDGRNPHTTLSHVLDIGVVLNRNKTYVGGKLPTASEAHVSRHLQGDLRATTRQLYKGEYLQASNFILMRTANGRDDGEPISPYPEGGRQAWATVFGAWFPGPILRLWLHNVVRSLPRDYLSQSSSSAISWIGSINTLLIVSVGLFIGRLYDRGHFHLLLYGGCLIQSFSIFMLSLCQHQQLYQIFLAQGVGMGLGAGIVYIPSVAIVSHYFHERRALAMSIVASGSSLGAVIHPIMLNTTLHSSLGFGTAVRASAGLISGLLLIACLIMRPRLPPTQNAPEFWQSLRRFGHDTPYVLATLGLAMFSFAFYFPLFFLQLDAVTRGIDRTFSFYSLVIISASSFVGRICPGFFAHSLGIANMATASAGCGAVFILGMIGLSNIASVVVLAILYGFCAGVFITTMAPLVAILTEDLTELGLRMGLFFATEGIGPPINGALHGRDFVWWRPALFSGLMGLVGFTFFLAAVLTVRHKHRLVTSAETQGVSITPPVKSSDAV
ncbi:major facilitator superfamily domain-containing protein [Mycena sanguinolenta]|nr:major facilitator superfamily domain-containing protein [Mycena sanguinolenta]